MRQITAPAILKKQELLLTLIRRAIRIVFENNKRNSGRQSQNIGLNGGPLIQKNVNPMMLHNVRLSQSNEGLETFLMGQFAQARL